MTRMLLLAAAFGLTAASAGACEFQRSVENKVDPTVVASVATGDEAVMSTAADEAADAKVLTDKAVE